MEKTPRPQLAAAGAVGALLAFAALFRGAHDLWAATTVYLAVLALLAAVTLRSSWSKDEGLSAEFALPIALLAAALSLSLKGAVNPGEALSSWFDWLCALGLFWAGLAIFRSQKEVDWFLCLMVPVIWVEFALILYQRWQMLIHDPSRAGEGVSALLYAQVPGSFSNANLAAAFLIIWLPVMADKAWVQSRGEGRWFWGGALAANALGLLLLNSAWALIVAALVLPWLWGAAALKARVRRRSVLALAAAVAAAAAACAILWWKLADAGGLSRLDWWRSGLKMFLDHPWLGVGPGNYPSAYLAYKTGGAQNTLFAHSNIVGLMAELGLLGCAAAAVFMFYLARRLSAQPARRPFVLGLLAFLLFGAISLSVEYLANLLAAALFAAIAAAGSGSQPRRPPRSAAIAIASAALAVVPYITAPFSASRLCVAGETSLSAGSVESALDDFALAARSNRFAFEPERGLARAYFARYRRGSGDIEAAVLHQRRACELNVLNRALLTELAYYLQAQNRPEEALAVLRKSAALLD